MEELEQIVIGKLQMYKGLYIVADESGQDSNVKYYGKCIKKLNKILNIL